MFERLDARLLLAQERGIDAEARSALLSGLGNLSITTRAGDVDVVQRLPGVPAYSHLAAESRDADLFDVAFRVCSRAHLIAMKSASGRPVDLADLELLEGE